MLLFQRAKIQDKCKQFTTVPFKLLPSFVLFQRAKIQDKCKQFTTGQRYNYHFVLLFQRAKIQDKCKQFKTVAVHVDGVGLFHHYLKDLHVGLFHA